MAMPCRGLLLAAWVLLPVFGDDTCASGEELTVCLSNTKFSGTCQVYKRGEAPINETPLGEAFGWIVVVGFGAFFTLITVLYSKYEYHTLGVSQSSEQFNTAGRNVGPGLTAAALVSQWTWAATLLMSSNMGWRVGISGPFWYASGATIQILLFAVLAVQVKRRASHMHTFMEIVKARFGTPTHCIMICFALMTNILVTSMLLLGGAATIEDLTGMSKLTAGFLIPIVSCWLYTLYGGLKATTVASYIHATIIFLTLIIFSFAVYSGTGEEDLWGSPASVHRALEKATLHGFLDATFTETEMAGSLGGYAGPRSFFSEMTAIMQNDGMCYNKETRMQTGKSCGFIERGRDNSCCSGVDWDSDVASGTYCRSESSDCISTSAEKHFDSSDCNFAGGERCVTSFLTMGSTIGLVFGITNIVGNFGTVFVDQSYWQRAVAAKPKSAALGFLIGGMVWFAVPFCMATTNGLAGRALTTHTNIDGAFGAFYIDGGVSGSGLTPARVLAHLLGPFGAFILLLQLFMAITSTGSAEIIAVSSILTYDVYYEYINPELKMRREKLQRIFYTVIQKVTGDPAHTVDLNANPSQEQRIRLEQASKRVSVSVVQDFMDELVSAAFFEEKPTDSEVRILGLLLSANAVDDTVYVGELYHMVNKAVSTNNIEGKILLRVSKFFTGLFAVFMGFLAVFLLAIGMNLGHVYMSMGCLVGSAVGPAALTIMMETANRWAIAAGAIGGLILAMVGWVTQAAVEFGEVKYETMMSDWPWVVGNLCAILGGTLIACVGSWMYPDKDFHWDMLNDRIPLVDDVEPPRDKDETEEKMSFQVKMATYVSLALTFVLLVLWPLPMHLGAGVFSEGGFAAWITLEMMWTIVAGAVIIFVPGYEMWRSYMGYDTLERSAAGGGVDLTIDLSGRKKEKARTGAKKNDDIFNSAALSVDMTKIAKMCAETNGKTRK